MSDPPSRNLILWIFLIYFVVSIVMLGWLLWPFVSTIILAATVTGIFNPVFYTLKRKLRPSIASFLTCIIIFVALFIPILSFVGIVSAEAYDLYLMARDAALGAQLNNLLENSQMLEKVNQLLANFDIQFNTEQLNEWVTEVGRNVGLFLFDQTRFITSNILKFIINFFFMLLIAFYLFIDQSRLLNFIFDLSPLPEDQDKKLFKKFKDMAGAVIIGNGICGLTQGVLGGAVFALFGLRSPFLWGVIMSLLAFLPIVGIGAVFIPTAGFLILNGRVGAGIFFIVFYVILSGGIEYLLKPKIVGQRVQMHTLLVFLSIIGGLHLFGILGIIYGPLIGTAFLTLTDIYHSSYQQLVETEKA